MALGQMPYDKISWPMALTLVSGVARMRVHPTKECKNLFLQSLIQHINSLWLQSSINI